MDEMNHKPDLLMVTLTNLIASFNVTRICRACEAMDARGLWVGDSEIVTAPGWRSAIDEVSCECIGRPRNAICSKMFLLQSWLKLG